VFFSDQIPTDVNHSAHVAGSIASHLVWPTVAALIPASVTAGFKWVQEYSGDRRKTVLTERVTTLAKGIAELPDVPLTAAATPRAALMAELEATVRELTTLQTRAPHRLAGGFALSMAKLRSALLLYRPRGLTGWLLHLSFYVYTSILLMGFLGMLIPDKPSTHAQTPAAAATHQTSPAIATAPIQTPVSNPSLYLGFAIIGIPPLVIRYFAAKIHRRQCATLAAAADVPTAASPAALASLGG
jgi:hypothetical protein